MIKFLIFSFLFVWNCLGLWFAYEVGRWWKETEDNIRIWPEGTRRNKDELKNNLNEDNAPLLRKLAAVLKSF